MASRMYRPGNRDTKLRHHNDGRMSGNRFAWLQTALGQMTILKHTAGSEEADEETGATVRFYMARPGKVPFSLNITALTKVELDAMRAFFTLLFDEADPTVQKRDEVAKDAAAKGDDSYVRIYRPLPQFVVRSGEAGKYNQGVRLGPEDFSTGSGGGLSSNGGVRGTGDELATDESEESSSQDDRPKIDEPEGFLEMGGIPRSSE